MAAEGGWQPRPQRGRAETSAVGGWFGRDSGLVFVG